MLKSKQATEAAWGLLTGVTIGAGVGVFVWGMVGLLDTIRHLVLY